jgi:hypothetical protein
LTISKYSPQALGPVLQIDNSGNGIGDQMAIHFSTLNSVRSKIVSTIESSPFAGSLGFYTGLSNASAERMTITGEGNVGIGVTGPATKLHVQGAGTTSAFYTNGDAVGQTLYLQDTGAGTGNGGQILFGASQGAFAGIKSYLDNGTGPAGSLILQTRTTTGNIVERLRIDSVGNLLVGTTVANATVAGAVHDTRSGYHRISIAKTLSGAQNGILFFHNNSYVGGLNYSDTATSFVTSSDARLKKDIINSESGLSKIKDIRIVSHGWKEHDEKVEFGVIAQELNGVYPRAVFSGYNGETVEKPWGVDYASLVPVLIKAVQELSAKVTALEAA